MQREREALIAWINSKAPQLPRVDAATKPGPKSGTVRADPGDGYVVLVPEGKANDAAVRLLWSTEDREKARPVEAGRYEIRRYVVVRKDWQIWATGHGRTIEVREGAETALELDLAVTLKMHVMRKAGRVQVGGAFSGDHGMGLSLVHGRDRIRVGWTFLMGDEKLGSGKCAYG